MKFSTSSDHNGVASATIFADGLVMIAERSHPRFEEIVEKINTMRLSGEIALVPEEHRESLQALFSMKTAIEKTFELTNRIVLKGESLFFDGKQVEGVLVDHVVRAISNGEAKDSYMPFINFWERVQANPTEHSRDNLLRWLMAGDFTITEDGTIVGYKGVQENLKAIHQGPGVVNGVSQPDDAYLDNTPGNVVEVARGYVTHNPQVHCAEGLHVGTWGYARDFGERVLEVHVDPVDVVSVPTDSNGQKMRVCKYKVIRELNEGYSLAILTPDKVSTWKPEQEADEEATCQECGEELSRGYCSENSCQYVCDYCDRDEDDCGCF